MTEAEKMVEEVLSAGWLKRDLAAAKREIKEWPEAIRPYLDGSYAASIKEGK